MNILLTGASGFIGQALQDSLAAEHQLYLHFRRPPRAGEARRGHAVREVDDIDQPLDAVINLAGENLGAKRWSAARKQALRSSRIDFTRTLIADLGRVRQTPTLWINGSAVGYYGSAPTLRDESSAAGADFAARLCVDWEAAAAEASGLGVSRLLLLRLGVVLGPGGGALAQMRLPFALGLGAALGPGGQHMAWISLADVLAVIERALHDNALTGPVNLVAPTQSTQTEFADTLARVLRRPRLFRAPTPLLRLLLGEMADILLADQPVQPQRLTSLDHHFAHPELESALRTALR